MKLLIKQNKRRGTVNEQNTQVLSETAKARRDFLRKSVYAACATPVIMSLLVEKADAAQSWNPGRGTRPPNHGTPPGKYGEAPNNDQPNVPRNTRWSPDGPGNR